MGLVAAPPHVLVYAYAYESHRTADSDKAYGVDKMDPGGGGTFMFHNVNQHYRSPSFAKPEQRTGTIAVERVRTEADGGIVLRVTERPGSAAAPSDTPATCVVFGDTTVVCDPDHAITSEEATLLKFLGNGFVDATRLDAARHWRIAGTGAAAATADFTIARADGATLDITETAARAPSTSQPQADIQASIRYDAAQSLPLRIDETTTEHAQRGVVSVTTSTHTLLSLQPTPP